MAKQPEEESLSPEIPDVSAALDRADFFDRITTEAPLAQVEEVASEHEIQRLVQYIFSQAILLQTSDIHLEPYSKGVQIRFRVDGLLHDFLKLPTAVAESTISRVKVMSDLNTSERRLPQDGSIKTTFKGRMIEFRVSTLPTIFGEGVVLRILNRDAVSLNLAHLGMRKKHLDRFSGFLSAPHGIVLLTGPTGSGKTTTLYAALMELNKINIKIITTEDPVEYGLEGISQIEIDAEIGLTFASSLRAILRQDPDIILVGEIRDVETAQISIQAALTGHLVFSTLHTRDAPSAIARLADMGVEPYLIGDTIVGIVAQRLIRKICLKCKTPHETLPEEREHLKAAGWDGMQLYSGTGCEACSMTGYRGRIGIYEMLKVSPLICEKIAMKESIDTIRSLACSEGMETLRQDGFRLVMEGITTVQEVLDTTSIDQEK